MNPTKTLAPILVIISFFFLLALHYWMYSSATQSRTDEITQLRLRVKSIEQVLRDTTGRHPKLEQSTVLLHEKQMETLALELKNVEFNLKKDLALPLSLGIPATLIAFLVFAFSLYKFVYNTAIEEAEAEVRKAFSPPQEQIKRESRIVVVSMEGTEDAALVGLLQQSGFEKVGNARIAPDKPILEQVSWGDYDLVVFNKFSDGAFLTALHTAAPNVVIVWFGGQRLPDDLTQVPSISSATFTSQLYGNLMNLLDYQRSIRSRTPAPRP